MIRTTISSGYSEPYCASEIKNTLSFNLLLNTQQSQWLFEGHVQWWQKWLSKNALPHSC